MDRTLLDMERIPTLEELRAFFKENDWSAAALYDVGTMDCETAQDFKHAVNLLDEHFEPVARKKGFKVPSSFYGKDNPLIQLRDGFELLVAGSVSTLVEETPEVAEAILQSFTDDPELEKHADAFLHHAVETAMEVMDYGTVAKAIKTKSTHKDFNLHKPKNFRAIDFHRQWNHSRCDIKTIPLQEAVDIPDAYEQSSVEQEIMAKLKSEAFMESLSQRDKEILLLKMAGKTQADIAKNLGYQNHSAVSKRLTKMRVQFDKLFDL